MCPCKILLKMHRKRKIFYFFLAGMEIPPYICTNKQRESVPNLIWSFYDRLTYISTFIHFLNFQL